jgi:two-component sensor histidine kinase
VTVVECSQLVLQRSEECVRHARRAVAEACRGMARDVIEIAQLLTSELVTNALQHGAGSISVEVARSRNLLRVSVDDESSDRPRRTSGGAEDVRGRGLMLVEALSARWGVIARDRGKRVWFELRTA